MRFSLKSSPVFVFLSLNGHPCSQRARLRTLETTHNMSGPVMGMEVAMAYVDAIVDGAVMEDADPEGPPRGGPRDENTPVVPVESGKVKRAKALMSPESKFQLDSAKATFDEYLGGKQVGLRREQAELWPMENLVSIDVLCELRELIEEAEDNGETFFPDKSLFPYPEAYHLLIKHHLTPPAYKKFDAYVTRWPGCFTRRAELNDELRTAYHFENEPREKKIFFTEVVATLEARGAFQAARQDMAGLVSPCG